MIRSGRERNKEIVILSSVNLLQMTEASGFELCGWENSFFTFVKTNCKSTGKLMLKSRICAQTAVLITPRGLSEIDSIPVTQSWLYK